MEEKTNFDILYEIATKRLNAQIERIDGIDAKIGVTFGLTNGLTAALAAFITLISRPVATSVLILVVLSSVAYFITLLFLFFAYKKSRWSFNPDVKTLKDICIDPKYHDFTDIVKEWVATECIRSIEWNDQTMQNKLKRAYRALITLSSQGLFLVGACVIYLVN